MITSEGNKGTVHPEALESESGGGPDKMYFINGLLIFCLLLFCPIDGFAKMYTWTDENGQVHISSQKPAEQEEKIENLKAHGGKPPYVSPITIEVLLSYSKYDLKQLSLEKLHQYIKDIGNAAIYLGYIFKECPAVQMRECAKEKGFDFDIYELKDMADKLKKQLALAYIAYQTK